MPRAASVWKHSPGRYYIVAGRIDLPTYYPGVVTANEGAAILVTPGVTVPGIDFVLNNVSAGRALSAIDRLFAGATNPPSWVFAMQTRVEGGKVPIFAAGRFPFLRLTRKDSPRIDIALTATSVTVPNPDYRATLENLPEGYTLKSLSFGTTDLTKGALQVTGPSASRNMTNLIPSPDVLSIVLQRNASPPPASRGFPDGSGRRGPVYLYLGCARLDLCRWNLRIHRCAASGRHPIVTYDNPSGGRPLGALVVVGNEDLPNLALEEISVAPLALGGAAGPAPAANLAANTRLPLSTIRGHVLDAMTGQPLNAGRVRVNNDASLTFSLGGDGEFEIPRLLPGNYNLEITAYGVGTVDRTIVLETSDAFIDVRIQEDP